MPWLNEGVYQPPGSELWGHGGGGYGYLAFLGFDKKKRRGVVVLSKQMNVNPSGVGWTNAVESGECHVFCSRSRGNWDRVRDRPTEWVATHYDGFTRNLRQATQVCREGS